jgi:hypothetical protein
VKVVPVEITVSALTQNVFDSVEIQLHLGQYFRCEIPGRILIQNLPATIWQSENGTEFTSILAVTPTVDSVFRGCHRKVRHLSSTFLERATDDDHKISLIWSL